MKIKEDFLHYLWDHSKIPPSVLYTTAGKPVIVVKRGSLNTNAGPDFLNAVIKIGDQLWAGHIEMHLHSSLWYEHGHQEDPNYKNVILHVVWRHDKEVALQKDSILPVIALEGRLPEAFLQSYLQLSAVTSQTLNCAEQHQRASISLWNEWYSELYQKRLRTRFRAMVAMAPELRTHWEELLFRAVFRYMGAKVNADSFYSVAAALGVERVRKIIGAGEDLETVLNGMAGLLQRKEVVGNDSMRLKEYSYLKKKYHLEEQGIIRPQYFRLRPQSFPEIRLSQLAALYSGRVSFFSGMLACKSSREFRSLFSVKQERTGGHRAGDTGFSRQVKAISKARIDLLLLNAVFPVLYAYHRNRGVDMLDQLAGMAAEISPEQNSVLNRLKTEGVPLRNAHDSQALLELYGNYCSQNRCLHCKIGSFIIGG
ncbi:DUF2851 family protein [Robertkochia marina]|uniref:DUF2851 family protein n=1 Tax=Robertkochia marina TaxID=1227945 RepID=A0A4V3UXX1_9FLAO|nr:DUF2851 family protein [Robertkochia marina]THD66404.1 DUF2851 family protein [Robertkochia marina]TRZ44083.1 DUF2851 family protein [Robertkochia marina]